VADIKVFVTELDSYYGEASENVSSRLAELILLPRPSLPTATGHSACTRLRLIAWQAGCFAYRAAQSKLHGLYSLT